MKELIKFAKKIKNEELRKKVIELLKNPSLSSKYFKKYPRMDIEDAVSIFTVSSPQGNISVERKVLDHTLALAELCLKICDLLEKRYSIKLNRDHLLSAALVHDLGKLYEWKKVGSKVEPTGIPLDHSILMSAELYHRNFPEEVIHIVASHFGEGGPTPPRTMEALIFHHLDNFLAMIEFYSGKTKETPIIFLDEDLIKKITES